MGGGGEARGGVQSVQKQYLYTPTRATECTAPTGNGNGMLTVLLFLFLSGATDGLVQRGLGYVSILFLNAHSIIKAAGLTNGYGSCYTVKSEGLGITRSRTRQHDESKQPDRDVSVCMYYPVPRYHSLSEQRFERTKGKPASR